VIQLTLTLKMFTAQIVETSVTVNNNSPIQDYVHPDDHTQPTYEITPGFKPSILNVQLCLLCLDSRQSWGYCFHTSMVYYRSYSLCFLCILFAR